MLTGIADVLSFLPKGWIDLFWEVIEVDLK